MVKLADIHIAVQNPTATSREDREVRIACPAAVDGDGLFTVTLPDHLAELAGTMTLPAGVAFSAARLHVRLQGKVLDTVKAALTELLKAWVQPEVATERVIRYNVESHVSFAEDDQGNIQPNGTFRNARWAADGHYGEHHATKRSKGGYALIIGARALDKKTIRRGDAVKVEYEDIHTGHVGDPSDPLILLNGWASFSLPDDAKEMPYTPEAALFFHRMMLGMAELSRRMQTFMHDEPRLLAAIQNGHMLLASPEAAETQAPA